MLHVIPNNDFEKLNIGYYNNIYNILYYIKSITGTIIISWWQTQTDQYYSQVK